MHAIEPFYAWRDYYIASEDENSPFFGRTYDEFSFHDKIYNFYVHPQWDSIESETMFVKIIYCSYEQQIAVIELLGEWNDAINNDIETLMLQVLQHLMEKEIYKFVLIGENILNFHGSDDAYYEDWYDRIKEEEGWIVGINFQEHVVREMKKYKLHHHVIFKEELMQCNWRKYKPSDILQWIEQEIYKKNIRLN